MSSNGDSELRPRLCHILKWPDFQGYGFNLHAEKGKAGQFIGKVDEDSPASSAGLKSGDRIVEVNGVNIGNENHQQVVKRVKQGGDQTKLLVVDEQTDQYYKEQKKVVRGDLPEVLHLRTMLKAGQDEPPPMPAQEPETIKEEERVESTVIEPVNNNNEEDEEHRPRLCHIRKWPDFQGYGFNLHAEKNKPGQYIGKVDEDSPAETAGLRENDRIIEVNGDNVEQEQHQNVIGKIKAGGDETKLLVVDPKTDQYYKEKGIQVTGQMHQVLYQVTPHRSLPENGETEPEVIHTTSDIVEADNEPEPEPAPHTIEDVTTNGTDHAVTETVTTETVQSTETVPQVENGHPAHEEKQQEPESPPPAYNNSYNTEPTPTPTSDTDGPPAGMSAKEYLESLKKKKKQDPRNQKMDFRQKHDLFQKM